MVRTRRQYKSGEASPPPHCLANASTTEQHNDYMLKFRAELAERRAAALAKEQEALGASDVDKIYEGVRRSQVDAGLRTWAEPADMAAATGGYAQQQQRDADVRRLQRSDAALAHVQGAGVGEGAGASAGAGVGAGAVAKPRWKPRKAASLKRAAEHAANKREREWFYKYATLKVVPGVSGSTRVRGERIAAPTAPAGDMTHHGGCGGAATTATGVAEGEALVGGGGVVLAQYPHQHRVSARHASSATTLTPMMSHRSQVLIGLVETADKEEPLRPPDSVVIALVV